MKRIVVVAAAMLTAVWALGEDVVSANAVGFVRTTVPPASWKLVSLPFENLDESVTMTIGDVLPDAPIGTRAWFYRNGAWSDETRGFGGWAPGTTEFIRGDALFVNAAESEVVLTVMGEVPSETTADAIMDAGWTLVGFAYPADIALTNTTLSAQANLGDRIWWWDGGWNAATKGFGGWDVSGLILEAGVGYFFNNTGSTFTWSDNKPYVWP